MISFDLIGKMNSPSGQLPSLLFQHLFLPRKFDPRIRWAIERLNIFWRKKKSLKVINLPEHWWRTSKIASHDSSSFHIKTGPKQTDKLLAFILFSFSRAAIFTLEIFREIEKFYIPKLFSTNESKVVVLRKVKLNRYIVME